MARHPAAQNNHKTGVGLKYHEKGVFEFRFLGCLDTLKIEIEYIQNDQIASPPKYQGTL